MRAKSERPTKRKERKCAVRYPDYHDYLGVSDEWVEQRRQELGVELGATGAKKKFTIQLHRMLDEVDGRDHSLVARWLPHGRAFVVIDKDRFEKELLPLYFPLQREIASFQRQLGLYGILRLGDGGYYHELLLRGRSNLVEILPRLATGTYSTRRRYDPATAPDFFAMTWLPDVGPTLPFIGTTDPVHGASLPPSSLMPRPVMKQLSIPKNERKPPPTNLMGHTGMPGSVPHDAPHFTPADVTDNSVYPVQALIQAATQFDGPARAWNHGTGSDAIDIAKWLFSQETSGASHPGPIPPSSHTNATFHSSGRNFDETIHGPTSLAMHDSWQRIDNNKLCRQREPAHSRLLAAGPVSILTLPLGNNLTEAESREKQSSFDTSNDDSSNEQEIDTGLDDMEISSESRHGAKLAEWAEFLEDVDLETSSGSEGQATPKP